MSEPIIYQRKPILVTAWRFTPGQSYSAFNVQEANSHGPGWKVETAGGWAEIREGDWLVRYPDSRVGVLPDALFTEQYESVAEQRAAYEAYQKAKAPDLDASLNKLADSISDLGQTAERVLGSYLAQGAEKADSFLSEFALALRKLEGSK